MFWALKAQSRRETCPQSSHSPLALPGPNRQACGPKAPVSKTLDLSLSCKGQCRGGGNTLWPSIPKKTREVAKEGVPRCCPQPEKSIASQGKASEAPGREGRPGGSLSPAGLSGWVMSMWPRTLGAACHWAMGRLWK